MEAVASEHLRLNGVYWGLCCLELLGRGDALDRAALHAWVLSCRTPSGGFGPAPGHDAHVLSTLSGVQALLLLGKPLGAAEADACAGFLARLQRTGGTVGASDGGFWGDEHGGGERDTRFAYAALAAAALLRRPCALDAAAAERHLLGCAAFDSCFGALPGGESHAGQAFTAVAGLRLCASRALSGGGDGGTGGATDTAPSPLAARLGGWLAQRQLPCGGLNGRPGKEPDVCYSWWVLSALACLRRDHWLDREALARFVLDAQDGDGGGIADRPEDAPDVFHTFFGVAALGLMGHPSVAPICPVLALPMATLRAAGVSAPPLQ